MKIEKDYSNGEKNVKGKEFHENGNLSFEGEYLNEERNGKGKEFFENGKLSFEGEYLNGKKIEKGNIFMKMEKCYLTVNILMEKCGMDLKLFII